MNCGKNKQKAIEWARANATLTKTPRYLVMYNGTYWMDKELSNGPRPKIQVDPDGTVTEVNTD